MKFIADFHIHSKYSRATSRDCVPEILDLWARKKGLQVVGTGDFTHPAWREELKEKLIPAEEGLYRLKEEYRVTNSTAIGADDCRPRFILSAEISNIYKKNGKTRKVHNVILLPDLQSADQLSHRLEQIGNVHSDGRPILGLDSRDLLEVTLDVCPEAIFIPAHIWTPHFSLFGAYSGFDRIEECYEDLTPHIHALETGLSSDPPMNWRISALDRYTLVSNSDAHSPSKLAREANLFDAELSFAAISQALKNPQSGGFLGTLELYPEEGKYHLDGHRNCKICFEPSETIKAAGICPACGRRITVGVLHRVEELTDRAEGFRPPGAVDFESIIPLPETIAASLGLTVASKRVQEMYSHLLGTLGSELWILRQVPIEELQRVAGPCVAEGIRRVRAGEVRWQPGYDGEYGKVTLLDDSEILRFSGQISFWPSSMTPAARAKVPLSQREQREKIISAKREVAEEISVSGGEIPRAEQRYGLNEQQWDAASAREEAVAVIAGPGTGKTRTLICHIRYLIEEMKLPPGQITAVTFTNKAAEEMRQRLQQELSDRRAARKVNIGTFHGICLGLLRQRDQNLSLMDESEALEVVENIAEELGLSQKPRDLLQAISRRKNTIEEREGIVSTEEIPQELFERYGAALAENNALDFDDLLLEVLRLYRFDDADAPDRTMFRYLLVDEFQDINQVQSQLLNAWSVGGRQLFVIGDPDQSIYGFRGSDALCFQKFAESFPNRRSIRLRWNYRSTPEILKCALPVIRGQELPDAEGSRELLAVRNPGAGVKLLSADSPLSEAIYVAKEINRMVGGIDMLDAHLQVSGQRIGSALGFSDIAILYRTHRQAALLEECLGKEGIPYIVAGREKYLEEKSVRHALTFFQHLLHPDNQALSRRVAAAVGSERLTQLEHALEKSNVRKDKPWKLLDLWITENGLAEDVAMGRLRGASLMHKSMAEFLQNLSLGQEGDIRRSGGKVYRSDAVTLMTLHGSKGLEFPVVFLCGVKEDTIPLRSFHGTTDLEEERRLLYVGMTRAKEELILLTSQEGSSPFLADLPGEAMQRGAVREKTKDDGRQLSFF